MLHSKKVTVFVEQDNDSEAFSGYDNIKIY